MASALGQPDGAFPFREASGEPPRERSEEDEDDDELDRLVDRVLEEALLEHGLLQVGARLLERRDEEVRTTAGHAAEEDRRDRRRDQRRDHAADRAGDDDVRHAEISLPEE